jgi:hypothetical protein
VSAIDDYPPHARQCLRIAIRRPRRPVRARVSPRISLAQAGGGGIMRVNASGGVAGEGHPASPGSVRCNWVVVVEYSLDERLCMEASEAAYSDEAYA